MSNQYPKYGFFIVLVIYEDGSRDLCSDYNDGLFKSEKSAEDFAEYMNITYLKNKYYHKYVSWSQYE